MSDPFKYKAFAHVEVFGMGRWCAVDATKEGLKALQNDQDRVFKGEEMLWVCRNEDLYASSHYKGKVAVRVNRDDFVRAKGLIAPHTNFKKRK